MDITEQQAHELFRLLDSNKDGFVTREDWNKNINYDTNTLIKETVELIRKKNHQPTQLLKIMGLEGVSKVDVHLLKEGLQKINGNLTDNQSMFLGRYIGKGNNTIPIENILEVLHLTEAGSAVVDK